MVSDFSTQQTIDKNRNISLVKTTLVQGLSSRNDRTAMAVQLISPFPLKVAKQCRLLYKKGAGVTWYTLNKGRRRELFHDTWHSVHTFTPNVNVPCSNSFYIFTL